MNKNGLIIQMEDSKGNYVWKFNDIFKWVPKEAHSLYWSILEFDAVGNFLDGKKSVQDFSDEIRISPIGLVLPWDELFRLGNKTHQVIDGLFIGCKDIKNIHQYIGPDGYQSYADEKEMYESCDYVINMFDTSYWIIFTKDQKFYDLLVQNFEIYKYIDSDETFGRQ